MAWNSLRSRRALPSAAPAAALALLVLLGGCREPAGPGPHGAADTTVPVAAPAAADSPGLERFRRWSDGIAQGGDPVGEAAFASLARLGFRVVLSVDGKPPEVELAAAHGLRYVHLPIGYDGISPQRRVEIVKAIQQAEGPVYVHCHHGRHRGPAAAALARVALEGVAPDRAAVELGETCSPLYDGLFAAVREFGPPSEAELAAAPDRFPSQVVPTDLVAHMLDADDLRQHLSDVRAAGWEPPADHPDLDPPHEALMLAEAFREMARLQESRAKGQRFLDLLAASAAEAARLRRALVERDQAAAERAYAAIKDGCKACHGQFRDT